MESSSKKIVGFIDPVHDPKKEYRDLVSDTLGTDFVHAIKIICDRIPVSAAAAWAWIQDTLLTGLADKYKYHASKCFGTKASSIGVQKTKLVVLVKVTGNG